MENPPAVQSRFISAEAYFQFLVGRLAADSGNCQRAVEAFRRAAAYDPESAYLHQVSAECLLRLGKIEESLAEAEKTLALQPDNVEVKLLKCRAFLLAKDRSASRKLLQEILRDHPSNSVATELLAELELAEGNEERAIELIQDIARSDPGDPRPTYFLGELFFKKRLYQKSVEFYQETLKRDPAYSNALLRLTVVYERLGQLEQAALAAGQLVELYPGDTETILLHARLLARANKKQQIKKIVEDTLALEGEEESAVQLADAIADGGQVDMALHILKRLLGRHRGDASAHLSMGRILASRGRLAQAGRHLQAVAQDSVQHAEAQSRLADVLVRSGQAKSARGVLQNAIKKFPDRYRLRLQAADLEARLGDSAKALALVEAIAVDRMQEPSVVAAHSRALYEVGRADDSIGVITKVLAQRFEDPDFLMLLALAQERLGNYQEAEGAARQVLAAYPNSVAAQNYLAYTYALREERLEEALDLAQQAHAAAPDDGYIADTLGFVLFKLKRTGEALTVLRMANELAPDEPEILMHLGDVEKRLKKKSQARKRYRRAQLLLPREQELRRALQQRLAESQ